MSNVRTMEFIDRDRFDAPVYKCIETGHFWKDINLGKGEPALYSSSDNTFDGEPCSPIKPELEVVFKTKYEESPYRHNYMMLDMMRTRCEYFLGYGNRYVGHLSGDSVEVHINAMKELWNGFPEDQKPQWLTFERIEEYEKQMMEQPKEA